MLQQLLSEMIPVLSTEILERLQQAIRVELYSRCDFEEPTETETSEGCATLAGRMPAPF